MKAPLTKRTTQEGRTGVAEEIAPEELEIADELIAERRTERPGETPEDMTPWQRPITGFIDLLNDWAGKLLCLFNGSVNRGGCFRSDFAQCLWHYGQLWLG